jgi:hypothetical protein
MTQGWPYEIRVQGQLSERWSHWFDDMEVSIEAGTMPDTTLLTTVVVDQAALLGILQKLYTLGLPLLLVQRGAATEGLDTAGER